MTTFAKFLEELESPEPLPEQVEESQPAEPVEEEIAPEPPEPEQDVEPELQPPEGEGEDEEVPKPPEPAEPEEIEVPKIEEEPFPEPPEPEREEPKEPEKPLPRQPTLEELMKDWPKQPPVEPLPEIDDDQWAQAMRFMGDGLEVTSQADGVSVANLMRPTDRFPLQVIGSELKIEYGVPTAAFSSGSTITLDPSDINGNDIENATNVVLHLSFTGGTTSVPIPVTAILAFVRYEVADENDVEGAIIGLLQGTHASPAAMYATFEGSETAQTDSWDITSQGANDGTTAALTTRIVYNHAGDKKVYGFYRVFTWDSVGLLCSWSAETRYEVDAAESC